MEEEFENDITPQILALIEEEQANENANQDFSFLQENSFERDQLLAITNLSAKWNQYLHATIVFVKQERREFLFDFCGTLCHYFYDVNPNLHNALPYYMDVKRIIKSISQEFIDVFTELFEAQSGTVKISETKAKTLFFKTHKQSSEATKQQHHYSKSFGMTLLTALCLLTETMDSEPVSGLASTLVVCLKLMAKWVSLNDSLSNPFASDEETIISNDVSVLRNIHEQLEQHVHALQFTPVIANIMPNMKLVQEGTEQEDLSDDDSVDSYGEEPESIPRKKQKQKLHDLSSVSIPTKLPGTYIIEENLTIRDKNPCILIAMLLKNISGSTQVFKEIFLNLFDKKGKAELYEEMIEVLMSLSSSTQQSNWGLLVQFANLITLCFGKLFSNASQQSGGVIGLNELCNRKVMTKLLDIIEKNLVMMETIGEASKKVASLQLCRLGLLYITEICVFALYTSLRVLPGIFMEFEQCDGYDIFSRLFLSVNTQKTFSSKANNAVMVHVYEQQKMLSVLRIMLCLVMELIKFVQRVTIPPNEKLSRHNEKVFSVLVRLFDNTDMEEMEEHNYFCCKYELLYSITQLLILFPDEYQDRFHADQPFHVFQRHFTKVSPPMQMIILKCFERHINLFDAVENSTRLLELLTRDIQQYGYLLLKQEQSIPSVLRVCEHCKEMLSPISNMHSGYQTILPSRIQKLFRLSGFTHILLTGLSKEGDKNIMSELLAITYLYLDGNLENHVDLLNHTFQDGESVTSLQILYSLLYDRKLIRQALDVIKQLVIADKEQKWHHIIADLIDILRCEKKTFKLGMHSETELTLTLEMSEAIVMTLRELLSKNLKTKNSLRNCQGLECIITVLNRLADGAYTNVHLVFAVMQSLILLLTKALRDNPENLRYFKTKIQFKSLLDPVRRLGFIHATTETGYHLCMNLIQLSLMTESLYSEQTENSNSFSFQIESGVLLIYNPEVICHVLLPLFGGDLDKISNDLAHFFFVKCLRELLVKYRSNRQKLCTAGCVDVLLKEFTPVLLNKEHAFQQTIVNIFSLLAAQHFPVKDMQYYFSLLKQVSSTETFKNRSFPDNLLEALMNLAKDEKFEPMNYIDFMPLPTQTMPNQNRMRTRFIPSVQLPRLSYGPWPSARGYTVTAWFRIEEISTRSNSVCLFCLKSQDSELMVEGFVKSNMKFSIKMVTLSTTDERKYDTRYIEFNGFSFKPNRWYFITLSHEHLEKSSRIVDLFTLYVNGMLQGRSQSEYEDKSLTHMVKSMFNMSSHTLEQVRFGASIEQQDTRPISIDEENSFSSFQLGNIFFIEGMLSGEEVYMIYHLGPNYIGYFDDEQFFTNEIINEKSVELYPKDIYHTRECSEKVMNETMKPVVERVMFVFSARDGNIATRLSVHVMSNMMLAYRQPTVQEQDCLSDGSEPSTQQQTSFLPTHSGDALMISKSVTDFTPVKTIFLGDGNIDLVSRYTFKSNLFSIGGMATILGLLSVVEKMTQKNVILKMLSYLMRYNSQNTQEMLSIDGYDLLNYILTQQIFLLSDAVLDALMIMTGLKIKPTGTMSSSAKAYKANGYDHHFVSSIKGVISNDVAFERLLLDFRIWREAPLRTQRNLFETLAYLVWEKHPCHEHHVSVYRTVNVMKKLLFALSQSHVMDQRWPTELIRPLVSIVRNVLSQPLTLPSLFPITRYIIMTHPPRGKTVHTSRQESISASEPTIGGSKPRLRIDTGHNNTDEPRRAVMQLLMTLMRHSNLEILEELNLNNFLPYKRLIQMLDNPSSQTRTVIMKIIGIYLTRLETARQAFFKHGEGIRQMEDSLKTYKPSIYEYQVCFDMLLNQFSSLPNQEEDPKKKSAMASLGSLFASRMSSEDLDFSSASELREPEPIESSPTTTQGISSSYGQGSTLIKNFSAEVLVDLGDEEESPMLRTPPRRLAEPRSAQGTEAGSFDEKAISSRKLEIIHSRRRKLSVFDEKKHAPSASISGAFTHRESIISSPSSNTLVTAAGVAELQTELFISKVDNFRFPEFLVLVFRMLTFSQPASQKVHVVKTLTKLFVNSGFVAKKAFLDLEAHKYMMECLDVTVVKGDQEYLIAILNLMIEYASYVIHLKNGTDVVSDMLYSFFMLKGYKTVSVQNLQRYILHGVLKHFQTEFLYPSSIIKKKQNLNKELYTQTRWDVQFARFCACAIDCIVQWFSLPPTVPTVAEATSPNLEEVNISVDYAYQTTSSKQGNGKHESTEPTLSLSAKLWYILERREYEQTKPFYRPKSATFLPTSVESETSKGEESRKTEQEIPADSITFDYSFDDITAFVYWLMDSMRICLLDRKKTKNKSYYSASQAELILVEQVKRLTLFLIDMKNSLEDNIFAMLSVLYFFPLETDTIVEPTANLFEEYDDKEGSLSVTSDNLKEATSWSQYLEDFATDQDYISRFIYFSLKLFVKGARSFSSSKTSASSMLSHLTEKSWNYILRTGKPYLKSLFSTQKVNPMHPGFVSIIKEAAEVFTDESHLGVSVLNSSVEEGVRLWGGKQLLDLQTKLAKKIKVLGKPVKKKLPEKDPKQVEEDLTMIQLNFLKPILVEIQSVDERDFQANKKWRKLLKGISDERSVLNAYEYDLLAAKRDDSLSSELKEYTDDSYHNVRWKLDPAAGPFRVRMRLKRHRVLKIRASQVTESSTKESKSKAVASLDVLLDQTAERQLDAEDITPSTYQQLGESLSLPLVCTRITPLRKYDGEFLLGRTMLYFFGWEESHNSKIVLTNSKQPKKSADRDQEKLGCKHISVSYEMIREIHSRRYLLRNSALEIFLTNGKSVFLAFRNTIDRNMVKEMLNKMNLPSLVSYEEEVAGYFIFKPSITQKWQNGLISNFEYLMHLNTLAGRSFNDVTQYPVFPYIVANLTGDELDLSDPKNFRDLSKPMGALNQQRAEKAIRQYEDLKEAGDVNNLPRHWGTHYSTPISVCYYLIRLEPFTRFFWEIQSGKLDVADRTFHDVKVAWELSCGISASGSDVKELIPEFYFMPEFLVNRNRVNFGRMQTQHTVDNVNLPKWAKGCPVRYVRMLRRALESEHVSRNLHNWIDLIFGYKQKGEEAVKALNLFHHVTYEGGTEDLESVDDLVTQEATWTQIKNYGQTPKQIFTKGAHAKRYQNAAVSTWGQPQCVNISPHLLRKTDIRLFKEAVGDIYVSDNSIVAVSRNKIFVPPIDDTQFDLPNAQNKKKNSSPAFLSFQHWDKTLRICKWENGKPISVCKWLRPENYICAAFSQDGKILALGSDACVTHIYKMNDNKSSSSTSPQKRKLLAFSSLDPSNRHIEDHLATLSGHSKRVICVHISNAYSIILTGSEDKTLIIWDLNRLTYVNSILHEGPVGVVSTSPSMGDIASFCTKDTGEHMLYLRTINGDLISSCQLESKATCMAFTWAPEGVVRNILAVGMQNGYIAILDSFELTVITKLSPSHSQVMQHYFSEGKASKVKKVRSAITAIAISPSMQEIIAGDDKGIVVTWSVRQSKKKNKKIPSVQLEEVGNAASTTTQPTTSASVE